MNTGIVNGFSSITNGNGALTQARINSEKGKFSDLLKKIENHYGEDKSTLSSSQVLPEGRINGDWKSGFAGTYSSENDKNAPVQGAAANQAGANSQKKTIDKTSKLYEKSMELESYFVKQMLSSMRNTVQKSGLGGNDFAGKMYDDMLWDEYAENMTKKAGFGLADQIYLSLAQ